MSLGYIERSEQIVHSFDLGSFAELECGPRIGHGLGFSTYGLGPIASCEAEIFLAAKTANRFSGSSADSRITSELPIIAMIASRAPELVPKLPLFLGLIALEGDLRNPIAFMTEDVSRDGELAVESKVPDESTIVSLDVAFSDTGGIKVFDDDGLDERMAFDVGGDERLLDFDTGVFNWYMLEGAASAEFEALQSMSSRAKLDLTIQIKPNSTLAQSLLHF